MSPIPVETLRHKARVLDDVGEKVLEAMSRAVTATREDLRVYRETSPEFAAHASSRGAANWIQDRLWHNACRVLEPVDDAVCYERGPVREVIVKNLYRIRLKRHGPSADVATYPTQGALDFMEQPSGQLVLEGMEQLRLICGYVWDDFSGEIGPAVLSMRDGLKNVLWVEELVEAAAGIALPSRLEPEPSVVRARLDEVVQEVRHAREP